MRSVVSYPPVTTNEGREDKTHDEPATVVVNVLLYRGLVRTSDMSGNDKLTNTYLILHHCIPNIFDQTSKFVCILDIFEKTFDLSLVKQWFEFSENIFQFPNDPSLSVLVLDLWECELTVPVFSSSILPSRLLQRRLCKVRQRGL